MHTLSQLLSGELLGCRRLTLSANLDTFPRDILSLRDSLEILDLSNNRLTELPPELAQLDKLKIIFLSNNQFDTLPTVLGQCPNLEMIGVKSNKINHVPAQSLPLKLRWLILTDNQIETLPDTLGERPKLQKLMLAGNKLTSLPATLSQAKNLQLIRISANQLTELPAQLLDLPKLAWLAFAGNPFCDSTTPVKTVPEIASSHFILQKELGQGASGVISQAEWIEPQSQFSEHIAVKKFKGGVTSDGYPKDELHACLKVGHHPNLVKSIAQVNEHGFSALVMDLIPPQFDNLGQPPTFETCTRDTFADEFSLSLQQVEKIIAQMKQVVEHLHNKQVSHGDLYAHNTLFDNDANILFGDFGAASMFHMLEPAQQDKIKQIEQRALNHFIDDLLSICRKQDRASETYSALKQTLG